MLLFIVVQRDFEVDVLHTSKWFLIHLNGYSIISLFYMDSTPRVLVSRNGLGN